MTIDDCIEEDVLQLIEDEGVRKITVETKKKTVIIREEVNNVIKTLIVPSNNDNGAKLVSSIRTIAKRTFGYCPSCGRGLDSYYDGNNGDHITHFCYNCGQAVKWE